MILPDTLTGHHRHHSRYRDGKDLSDVVGVDPEPYILVMDEKNVRDRLGPPDKIIGRSERMRSRVWLCSSCKLTITSIEPIPVPAPCPVCGGIAFESVELRHQ
jgi:rubrerythrin